MRSVKGVWLMATEILALILASLKQKVESLDDDRWMFEAEEEIQG